MEKIKFSLYFGLRLGFLHGMSSFRMPIYNMPYHPTRKCCRISIFCQEQKADFCASEVQKSWEVSQVPRSPKKSRKVPRNTKKYESPLPPLRSTGKDESKTVFTIISAGKLLDIRFILPDFRQFSFKNQPTGFWPDRTGRKN